MGALRAEAGVPRFPGRVEVPRRERCTKRRSRDLCGGRGEWLRGWAISGRNLLENPLALRIGLEPLVLPLGLPVPSSGAMSLFVAAGVYADVVA